jgi:hypothetical protein
MRKSLLAVVASAAAAMLAMATPSTASADLPLLGATFNVASLASLQPSWTVVTRFDLGFAVSTDSTSAGRRNYEVLASLPATQSAVRTYDVKPIVDTVTNQKVKLGTAVTLTLISGKNLLVADVGKTQLALAPTSFGSGVFTVGGAF